MIAPEINRIYTGDCLTVMAGWPENFVDTIITDPPYGISFMGKAWDTFDPAFVEAKTKSYREGRDVDSVNGKKNRFASAAQKGGEYDRSVEANRKFQDWCCAWATEALRIAKPGAMMLVSGGTRTFHRMTAGIEDAGWQIRDCLMWLYGSGFPKSLDISKAIDKAKGAEREVVGVNQDFLRRNPKSNHKNDFAEGNGNPSFRDGEDAARITVPATDLARQWSGWGTALKPAWEPIILAMKPLDGTFAENAEKWGVAGLNVDGGRIGADGGTRKSNPAKRDSVTAYGDGLNGGGCEPINAGRWPANLILDEDAAGMLDGVSAGQMHGAGSARSAIRKADTTGMFGMPGDGQRFGDSGGASRFFYVAKSGRAERNEGCEGMTPKPNANWPQSLDGNDKRQAEPRANNHPTVKPLSLMKYLCQLTRTPTGGIVLDPFAGSGTTLWAAEFHNRPWIGIEMNPEYVAIAEARIARERSQMKMAI